VRSLSNSGFDSNLFDYFQADVCLELNVKVILTLLNESFMSKEGGTITAQNVNYADTIGDAGSLNCSDLVFTKATRFNVENEFRIAIFYPHDEKTFLASKTDSREPIPMFSKDPYVELTYMAPRNLSIRMRHIL
jgi:hypothetical protein